MMQITISVQGLYCLLLMQQFFDISSSSLMKMFKSLLKYANELTFTTLLANSVDDKLIIFFLFFPEYKI